MELKSTIVRQWIGGFVGQIEVPITSDYTSWKIVLEFNRRVSKLFVSILSLLEFQNVKLKKKKTKKKQTKKQKQKQNKTKNKNKNKNKSKNKKKPKVHQLDVGT